jgi:RNA polymerase sigma-70 factor (ECF subfamily)
MAVAAPPPPVVADEERELLNRCLSRQFGAWNDFVDRYLALIYRVIHFTTYHRSVVLNAEDIEDLAADILLQLVANDYAALRQFQGRSSLSTYLTVIARRICVRALIKRQSKPAVVPLPGDAADTKSDVVASLETQDAIHSLLNQLPPKAREAARLRFFEGRSYEEISTQLDMPVNTVGPLLSRVKAHLKKKMTQQKAKAGKGGKPPAAKATAAKAAAAPAAEKPADKPAEKPASKPPANPPAA